MRYLLSKTIYPLWLTVVVQYPISLGDERLVEAMENDFWPKIDEGERRSTLFGLKLHEEKKRKGRSCRERSKLKCTLYCVFRFSSSQLFQACICEAQRRRLIQSRINMPRAPPRRGYQFSRTEKPHAVATQGLFCHFYYHHLTIATSYYSCYHILHVYRI